MKDSLVRQGFYFAFVRKSYFFALIRLFRSFFVLTTSISLKYAYMNKTRIIGIALGGTKCAITKAALSPSLEILWKKVFPSSPEDPEIFLKNCFDILDKEVGGFSFISIISGGPMNIEEGTLETPPHLPGFKHFPIVSRFKKRYNVPVTLLNDADACALAEYRFGSGKGFSNLAYCTFGTGFGAGLILNGKLYQGENGMAGEIGHIRLSEKGPVGYQKEGSVEGYCAGGNIYKWANVEGVSNTKELFGLARKGNEKALSAVKTLAKRLGETCSILADTLNLQAIILGGIYPRNIDLLEKEVLDSFEKETLPMNATSCQILPSSLGEKIDEYSSLMGYFVDSKETDDLFERYPALKRQKENIEKALSLLIHCYEEGGKILVCGNGGSSADSSHIVGELLKGFRKKRPLDESLRKKFQSFDEEEISKFQRGIPAIDLTSQSAFLSAYSNDCSPELVYAQEVLAYSERSPFDLVLGISTSGNSKNVVNAIKAAKALGLKTISLTGEKESLLSRESDVCIQAPASGTYKIQEYHLPIYHYLCMKLEERFFSE